MKTDNNKHMVPKSRQAVSLEKLIRLILNYMSEHGMFDDLKKRYQKPEGEKNG